MMNKIKFSILIFLISMLTTSSCTTEKRIKRANKKIERLTERFPSLLVKDTIYDTFSIVTPSIKLDTAFISQPGDTVYLTKDKLRIKYVLHNDTISIQGECISDTIIKTVKIPYEVIRVEKESFIDQLQRTVKKFFWWILCILAVIIGLRFLIKFLKPTINFIKPL